VIEQRTQNLQIVGWFNIACHLLGLCLAFFAMSDGTALIPLQERMTFLAEMPLGWSLSWGVWMLCALAFLAFTVVLVDFLPKDDIWARLAYGLVISGVAIDFACDSLQIVVLPQVAALRDEQTFIIVERCLGVAGTVGANGLYSLAVLLLTVRFHLVVRLTVVPMGLGYATFFFGTGLALAGFTGYPQHLQIAAGSTILTFAAWTFAMMRYLPRREIVR